MNVSPLDIVRGPRRIGHQVRVLGAPLLVLVTPLPVLVAPLLLLAARLFLVGVTRSAVLVVPPAVLVTAAAVVTGPAPASATDDAASPAGIFRFGAQEIGLVAGPGFAIPIGGTDSEDLRDVRYLLLAPRWGIQLTGPLGRSWYRGNVEFLVDGRVMLQVEPRLGVGGGPVALLRYNVLSAGPTIVPFVEFGGGIMGTSFHLKDRPDGLDFAYETGFGIHYFVASTLALTVSTHFHHVSNAYLKNENLGINSIQVEFGLSKFFR